MKLHTIKLYKLAILSLFIGAITLTGCGEKNAPEPTSSTEGNLFIKVGVIAGAEFDVAEFVKKQAKENENLDVELMVFNDYVTPNEALNNGDIDINIFQHKPYLDQQIKDRGYKLVMAGNTFIYPIAAYSKKIKNINEIQQGATVAIPNDPTNLGRSLLLLEKQGLIKLKAGAGSLPTSLDIIENPKNLKIIEIEAPQLTRSLDDPQIDFAIINTAYSSQANLTPTRDGIFMEDKDSPYVNIIVARENNKNAENVKAFIRVYQTEATVEKSNEIFQGSSVKGW